MAPGAFPVTLAGSATRQLGAAIGGNNVKEFEEGATSLYPPLNIPEPYINDKKRAVLNSMMKYKKLIDEARTEHIRNYKPSGVLVRPDLSAPDGKHKAAIRTKTPKVLDVLAAAEEKNAEADTEDEELGVSGKKNEEDELEGDPAEAKDTEDEDEEQVADNDSVDDYTEAVGFDDDEGGFEETGGGGDDDIF